MKIFECDLEGKRSKSNRKIPLKTICVQTMKNHIKITSQRFFCVYKPWKFPILKGQPTNQPTDRYVTLRYVTFPTRVTQPR